MKITKSTSVAAIKAAFPSTEEMLAAFEEAKTKANEWDGRRDGLREAVKTLAPGKYGSYILDRTVSEEVCYPNAEGKHQLMNCLQCDLPAMEPGTKITVNGKKATVVDNKTLYGMSASVTSKLTKL